MTLLRMLLTGGAALPANSQTDLSVRVGSETGPWTDSH